MKCNCGCGYAQDRMELENIDDAMREYAIAFAQGCVPEEGYEHESGWNACREEMLRLIRLHKPVVDLDALPDISRLGGETE